MARRAKALETLLQQVNELAPRRNKASDGWIGDEAHRKVPSDHNPNADGVVTAQDITHDPKGGLDAHALADRLITHRHPTLKYVISDGRIAGDWTGWVWRKYYGSNPHEKHIHVSVGKGDDGKSTQPYDDTTPWNIKEEEEVSTLNDDSLKTLAWALQGFDQDEAFAGKFLATYKALYGNMEANKAISTMLLASPGWKDKIRNFQKQNPVPDAEEKLAKIKEIVNKEK